MIIARWTTPGLDYKPLAVSATDIVAINLVIRQGGEIVIEKDISSATLSNGTFHWDYTQEETSKLNSGYGAVAKIDYLTSDGKRFTTRNFDMNTADSAKNEVM